MTETDWQKVKEIVYAALDKTPAERPAFLSEACGADSALREEVESLLASHKTEEDFIEIPVFALSSLFKPVEPSTDKLFGPYKIVSEIGRGGMGVVFLAERADGEFKHRVALKIVRQTILDLEAERRFRRERQILASMQHPNIAQLLDGGVSEAGEPYLAMEYIAGADLLEFVEKQNLDEEKRLRLFLKICSAVAYAHRNLIVHRDIKPSNIIVTKEGEPKLLDFGLAKMLDESLDKADTTRTEFRALTPAYASPEQQRGGNVTTISDIYSLGIVFYELIKNSRFSDRGKNYLTDKPETDLDAIILTALDEQPERRYQTVEAFAADVERFLTKKPVKARPNTFAYRAEKFIKRNKYAVAAAALIFLTLTGGVVATLWQARIAEAEKVRAEAEKVRAEKRFGEVRQLANSLMFEIHDSVKNLQGSTPTRQLIVSRALEYLDSLAQEASDDANLQIELATAYEKIGDIQGNPYSANLGDTVGAMNSYRKAVAILENLKGAQATNEARMAFGRSYRALGDIEGVEGENAQSIDYYRRSLAIFEQLASNSPQDTAIQDEYARAFETLGDGLDRMENTESERLESYRKNLEIRQKLVMQAPNDAKFRRGLALAFMKFGTSSDENKSEAVESLRKAIQILEDLSGSNPDDAHARREVAFAYFKLGSVFIEAKDFAAALVPLRQALSIRQELVTGDPRNNQALFDSAIAYGALSEALTDHGDVSEAIKNASEAREILEKLSADDSENNVYRRNLGLSYEKLAQAHERAGSNEKLVSAEREKNWISARAWYQKTRQVFVELRQHDALQPRDEGRIEQLDSQMMVCQEALNRLKISIK